VCRALKESRPKDAASDLDRLTQVFGRDNVYVEIQNAGLDEQARINPLLVQLAEQAGLPPTWTSTSPSRDATESSTTSPRSTGATAGGALRASGMAEALDPLIPSNSAPNISLHDHDTHQVCAPALRRGRVRERQVPAPSRTGAVCPRLS
jgi:error-prone DNA polymerase